MLFLTWLIRSLNLPISDYSKIESGFHSAMEICEGNLALSI